MAKANVNAVDSNELGCLEPSSLLSDIRSVRANLIKQHNSRMRDLDRAERMLVDSDAENIIRTVRELL